MGLIHTELELSNPAEAGLSPMRVTALVDSGANYMCVPEDVVSQLRLSKLGERVVEIADGSVHTVDYVGPIIIRFENRVASTGAMAMGDEVLLGAIPMQDLDVVLNLQDETIEVNPRSPNIARGVAK